MLLGSLLTTSCNSKDELPDDYVPTESVAVTAFSLTADARVMKDLDAVFFSIDLVHGVIFNADSLPKGTPVKALIPKITYPSTVNSAQITMSGGSNRTGTVNYLTNPSDTIDFTGDVTLELKAGEVTSRYVLKVNVHKEDPDTLIWDNLAMHDGLPSRLPSPLAQKTVARGDGAASLLQESDGSYTLSTCGDLFKGSWSKQQVNPGFTPKLRSFTTAGDKFYILDANGKLYESTDGLNWQGCDANFVNLIGDYEGTLTGIIRKSGKSYLGSYPEGKLPTTPMPSGFPTEGYSAPVSMTSDWSPATTMMIFGGEEETGAYTGSAWAFDGRNWVNLSDTPLPALSGVAVFPYFTFLNSTLNGTTEFNILVAMGGRKADGSINEDVYISYNGGLSWIKGPEYLQLPAEMKVGYDCDAVIGNNPMSYDLNDNWRKVRSRIKYEIDGDNVKWDCPYIFLFGGVGTDGKLQDVIRTGVLKRLTFAPLF